MSRGIGKMGASGGNRVMNIPEAWFTSVPNNDALVVCSSCGCVVLADHAGQHYRFHVKLEQRIDSASLSNEKY